MLIAGDPIFLSPHRDAAVCRQFPSLHLLFSGRIGIPAASITGGASRSCQLSKKNVVSGAVRRCNSSTLMANSTPSKNGVYTVGDFMTGKQKLQVVKPSTTIDEALEALVENKISGFPVIDDDWKLVGLVSDYDMLALDSISGNGLTTDASIFPEVDSTWKVFNELQKLLSKTNGKLVADVMTQAPLVVRETTNLEDATRLLLETRYRRLPVVDADGKLVGILTRGDVIRAALQMKRDDEEAQ